MARHTTNSSATSLFQEELAQASPQQADIDGSATPQGNNHLSSCEEADCQRETPGDKLRAAKAEAQARASRTLIGSIIPYINAGADSLKPRLLSGNIINRTFIQLLPLNRRRNKPQSTATKSQSTPEHAPRETSVAPRYHAPSANRRQPRSRRFRSCTSRCPRQSH